MNLGTDFSRPEEFWDFEGSESVDNNSDVEEVSDALPLFDYMKSQNLVLGGESSLGGELFIKTHSDSFCLGALENLFSEDGSSSPIRIDINPGESGILGGRLESVKPRWTAC